MFSRDVLNTRRKGYRTGNYPMGITYRVCPQKGWFPAILRLLQEVERCNDSLFIPISRTHECIDGLGEATVFYTLNASSGYRQIEIDERDRDKAAFLSHYGLYRLTRMLFGLKNALRTFQRAADIIFASVQWQFAIVYLDDIVVVCKSTADHIEKVLRVLRLLFEA